VRGRLWPRFNSSVMGGGYHRLRRVETRATSNRDVSSPLSKANLNETAEPIDWLIAMSRAG